MDEQVGHIALGTVLPLWVHTVRPFDRDTSLSTRLNLARADVNISHPLSLHLPPCRAPFKANPPPHRGLYSHSRCMLKLLKKGNISVCDATISSSVVQWKGRALRTGRETGVLHYVFSSTREQGCHQRVSTSVLTITRPGHEHAVIKLYNGAEVE